MTFAVGENSIAFVLAALCCLQPEADHLARQLGLSCPSFLERTNLVEVRVSGGRDHLSALLSTTNFAFTFNEQGQMTGIVNRKLPYADAHIREDFEKLAQRYSDLDTNSAYQLARHWLAAIDVDINRLEKKNAHRVTHPELDRKVTVPSPDGKRQHTRIVPLFWVTWSASPRWNPYTVQVELLGPSRELARLEIMDSSFSKRPEIKVPGEMVLEELPNQAFTNLWLHPELSATNVFGLLHTSTPYQAEILRRMLAEANWALSRLGIFREAQLKLEDLTESFVAPPQFGFRGCIGTKDSYFQFDEAGKLKYIALYPKTSSDPAAPPGSEAYYQEMSGRPLLVDSNSVLNLVAGCLAALEIDVAEMSRLGQWKVERYNYERGKPSHLWWLNCVDPRGRGTNLAWVVVDGTTKLLGRIRVPNTAFSRRAGIGITNAEELMRIADTLPQCAPLAAHLNVLAARANLR